MRYDKNVKLPIQKEKPNPTPEKSSMQGGPAKSPSKGKREFKKRKMIEKQKAHAIKITKNKMVCLGDKTRASFNLS